MISYALTFCSVTIGLVFAWSFVGKVRDISGFELSIIRFQILPRWLVRPAMFAFLAGELAVPLSMLASGPLLEGGFLLAVFMLTIFCVALGSVMYRRLQTSCNCFGSSKTPISFYDLVRNLGLIACALGGYVALRMTSKSLSFSGWLENGLVGVVAVVFVVVWVQLGEIVRLFYE